MPVLLKLFQKLEKDKFLTNPLCEPSIALISKPDKEGERKRETDSETEREI
jgi:hypothetical protein